ncbi:meiotic fizzy-related protein 1-like [Pomacea canaliculata]|uniref:meiotic fizzy-related protein 1-like n=1 Tax=Pomacea canaliculata TaxID=400727 RepID=UPI000D72EF5C|nr:meiotic fizzy-related protein 1-like [Pomacea canaliculata]
MAEGYSHSVYYSPGFNPSGRRGSAGFDRFIPHRPSLCMESAHHRLLQGLQLLPPHTPVPLSSLSASSMTSSSSAATEGGEVTAFPFNAASATTIIANSTDYDEVFGTTNNPGRWEYERRLSAALAEDLQGAGVGVGGGRILTFSNSTAPPSPALSPFFLHSGGSDPWIGSPKRDASLGSPNSTPRCIRTQPEKILELSLRNDFYCSLMDWGNNDSIAVGVGKGAYVFHALGKGQDLTPALWARGGGGGGGEGVGEGSAHRRRGHVSSVKWNNSGTQLALGYSQGLILICDAEGMRIGQELFAGKRTQVGCLAWHGRHLYCGTSSGRVFGFDLRESTPRPAECPPVHRGHACSIQLSPDESMFASGGNDGVVNVWDPRASGVVERIKAHVTGAKALGWCPWRRGILASGGGASDGHIRIWNVGGQTLKTEVNTQMQVCSILWSEAYRELVSSHSTTDRHEVVVWSTRNLHLSLLARLPPPAGRPLFQCLSPDGTTLASASSDDRLRMWKLFPKKKKPSPSTSPLNLDRLIR